MPPILPKPLRDAAEKAARLLHERNETLSVAETAAGGLISASILATPRASRIYAGGLTLYTLQSRVIFAGWTQADVDDYKGPTLAVVRGIAANVNAKLQSTYTICESGTAGPTGGESRERTPGFVALAVATRGGEISSREIETGSSDRQENMVRFAVEALGLLIEVMEERNGGKL